MIDRLQKGTEAAVDAMRRAGGPRPGQRAPGQRQAQTATVASLAQVKDPGLLLPNTGERQAQLLALELQQTVRALAHKTASPSACP